MGSIGSIFSITHARPKLLKKSWRASSDRPISEKICDTPMTVGPQLACCCEKVLWQWSMTAVSQARYENQNPVRLPAMRRNFAQMDRPVSILSAVEHVP